MDFDINNKEEFERLMCYYRCAIMEIETKFKVLDAEFSMRYDQNPIAMIKSRIKSMDSLVKKLERKGLPVALESIEKNIFDVAGVRVVCTFLEEVYLLADCILQQDDIRLIERKDYIENPKESGYRSLHLIVEIPIFLQAEKRPVKVEIQLRTIAMDTWASLEHQLRYKKALSEEEMERLNNELKEGADLSAKLDNTMQKAKQQVDRKI